MAFIPYTRRIYVQTIRVTIGLQISMPPRPSPKRLLCGSCASGRDFACSFLQTPLRSDALAVRLRVPVITVSRGTCTLQATSRFGFPYRLQAIGNITITSRNAWRTKEKGTDLKSSIPLEIVSTKLRDS